MKIFGIALLAVAIPLWQLKPHNRNMIGGFGPGMKIHYGRLLAIIAVVAGAALILLA